jgi:hypothetical protein
MAPAEATMAVTLGFVPRTSAVPDLDHPGLLRAGPRASAPYERSSLEHHVCSATDWSRDTSFRPDLLDVGFDTVDLSGLGTAQLACERVRRAGHVTDDDASAIRAALQGTVLRCSSGRTITVMYLAPEGFIMRTSGPNGLSLVGPRSTGMNGHSAATSVHADQDVYGTPLTQVMDNRAPSLFRHDSPDGANRDAGLMLVNLWIPLQQITQPLVLGDGRSIDRRRHQLRYGLATQTFLERDEDMAINDIWTFLHDDAQRWYLRSAMDHREAYVFDTLSTPHASCALPGEDIAEHLYRSLEAAEAAVTSGDRAACRQAVADERPPLDPNVPPALRAAIEAMAAVVGEAQRDPADVCGPRADAWLAASRTARSRVVRMSLEMRMVVSIEQR